MSPFRGLRIPYKRLEFIHSPCLFSRNTLIPSCTLFITPCLRHYTDSTSPSTKNPQPSLINLYASSAFHHTLREWSRKTWYTLQHTLLPQLSTSFNTLTGYDKVATLKDKVVEKDLQLDEYKKKAALCKQKYEETIDARRKCQSHINTLLQRKDSWVDADIHLFTELYRKDLGLENEETAAKQAYKQATDAFEQCHVEYLRDIRERYIEEQLYSDKIRRASTWWTWGLISIHLGMFIVIQLVVEPRKRSLFQSNVVQMMEERSSQQQDQLNLLLDQHKNAMLQELYTRHESQSVVETPAAEEPQSSLLFSHDKEFYGGVALGLGLSLVWALVQS